MSNSSILQNVGITTDATPVVQAIDALGPIANDTFSDYSLLVAALTTTVTMLLLVIFLTDISRQNTLPYWTNLLFLFTAAVHFTLLIVSYRAVFFGQSQLMAVVILHSVFAALSKTIADWVLLLRVRKSFPTIQWLLIVGMLFILCRFVVELIAKVTWNIAAVNNAETAYVVGYVNNAPNVLVLIFPWLSVITDSFFCSVFIYRFIQKMHERNQEDRRQGMRKRDQTKRLLSIFVKEQNMLPALITTALAIVQLFNVNPNKYGAINLFITAIHVPFASVWRALDKLKGDPGRFLAPIAEALARPPGGGGVADASLAAKEKLIGQMAGVTEVFKSKDNKDQQAQIAQKMLTEKQLESQIVPESAISTLSEGMKVDALHATTVAGGTGAAAWLPALAVGLNSASTPTTKAPVDPSDVIDPDFKVDPAQDKSLFQSMSEKLGDGDNDLAIQHVPEEQTLSEVVGDRVEKLVHKIKQ